MFQIINEYVVPYRFQSIFQYMIFKHQQLKNDCHISNCFLFL